ncbi:MAG: hypothetical protein J6C85_02085 [Alphaproteobacteria bacterium]|nr:hypothetical protein [Alphaproteobacteria bacterium]
MSNKEKQQSIKDKIRDKMLKLGLAATTLAPMAPTTAEAATPEAPEQPKTEQYAPNQTQNNNNDKTFYINGIGFTPVSEVPNSNTQQTTRRQTVPQQQTTQRRQPVAQQTRSVREIPYGTPEWARANGWIYDAQLSNGLNRLGATDGSHNGYQGAYFKADDPDRIMFLPNDALHDKPEFAGRGNAKASQFNNSSQYCHANHDKYGRGCPDQKRKYGNGYGTPHRGRPGRAERIVHGAVTVGAIIDAATRGGR